MAVQYIMNATIRQAFTTYAVSHSKTCFNLVVLIFYLILAINQQSQQGLTKKKIGQQKINCFDWLQHLLECLLLITIGKIFSHFCCKFLCLISTLLDYKGEINA